VAASLAPRPGGGALRRRLGLGPQVPLAVYVGSVTLDRGLPQCVEAMALLPGVHFAIVGPRHQGTADEIAATASRLGIADRVHLVDPVPSREVPEFVAGADCSVIAIQNVCLSYYFCFPNKLLESVTSGLPVAVARLVELERFIARFPVGVTMDEKDPADIARAIGEVIAQPQRYRPDAATIAQIRAEYGWAVQQRRLLELYERLQPAEAAVALSGA
jgi:glycosyltransferase involved in cell wall biosynthesis